MYTHLAWFFIINLIKARTKFNFGKIGRGRANSKFRCALEIWEQAGEIYFGGTHSDYKSLSFKNRATRRNNQFMEGSHNGTIVYGKCDVAQTARGSDERFVHCSQMKEVAFTTHQYQINVLNSGPKTKHPTLQKKDKTIQTIITQRKNDEITPSDY